jgi:hypothetical protein
MSLTIAPRPWISLTQRAISTRARLLRLVLLLDRSWIEAAAVSRDLARALEPKSREPLLFPAPGDQLLDQRADQRQLVVRLLRCEVPRHVAPMIRASWAPVNESSSDPRGKSGCRPPGRRAPRSRSSSGRAASSGSALSLRWPRSCRCETREPARWDDPALTHDLGGVTDVWARWDSVHFLRVAEHGYSASEAAFYPLYPALVAAVGRALGGHYVLGGVLVSLARRAGCLRPARAAGGGTARRQRRQAALLYLALFPTAFFLQAVYSESLFLLLCLGPFALAERGRFAYAGISRRARDAHATYGIVLCPALA